MMVLPAGAARAMAGAGETHDWYAFLRALTGIAPVVQPTPEMVALLGEACERTLIPASYFGKVRLSPRFHSALAHSLCHWSMDGLTPDLLEQGADAVLQQHAALAELDDDALREEWTRKTRELASLWRAWQAALTEAGLMEPIRGWQILLDALPARAAPPLVMAGFTELTAMDCAALRILDARTPIALVALHDDAHPDAYRPTARLAAILRAADMPLQEILIPAAPVAPPQMTILDTPNPLYEVETVAREILKLQQEGVALDEIALLVRQPDALAETLAVIFARYEIPLQGEVGLPLERSWRVRWLMDGVRVLMGVGVGADWLHWLEHPAHRLDYATLRPLHRLRRHQSARSWLDAALTRAADPNLHRLLQRLHEWRQGLPASLPQVARRLIQHLGTPTQESDLAEWLQLIDAYARQWRRLSAPEATNLLERLVSGARSMHRLGTSGVRLLPMEHADLVETQVAFALQVLEGTLPRRCPDDPFLREAERNALNAALGAQGVCLPTRADAQAAEPMLFQRILHSAREQLFFSYPRTQGGDSDSLPSFYLETLKARLGDAVRTRFYSLEAITPAPEDALHPYDQSLREPTPYAEPPPILRHPDHRARLADLERPFSVTELETLLRCPFEHFARYVLRLRPLVRELSLREVGSVTHATLCRAVRQRPRSHDPQEWVQRLVEHLQALLAERAPDLPDWQVEVLRALAQRLARRFGWREPRYLQQFGLEPHACEWAFGSATDDEDERTIAEPLHNQQQPRRVVYRLGNGREIALCGVIDRIDLSPQRDLALVLDYKLGTAPRAKDLTEGRAVQGLLYVHAVRSLLPNAQVVLAYDRLKAGKRVRFVPNETQLVQRFNRGNWEDNGCVVLLTQGQWRQAENRLRHLLTQAIDGLRHATIAPTPGDHCRRCAFADLCRTAQR
ncbi:MAG: PD-(D/E)XK nuclease family protein [Armatimonadetes bacterium]|nr:PD-(D/E)XK nuclease family protein [Armatimonadota bacterium]